VNATAHATVKAQYHNGEVFAAAKNREESFTLLTVSTSAKGAQVGSLIPGKKDSFEDLGVCTDLNTATSGAAERVFLQSVPKSDGTMWSRALVVSEDHSLTFIVDGKAKWRREEALATVAQVEFVDLPLGSGEEVKGMAAWTQDMIKKVSGLSTPTMSGSHAAKYGVATNNDQSLTTDKFQIRKVAVAITTANKVFAINTESAEIVWSKFYGGAAGSLKRLYLIRNTGKLPAECLVVFMDGPKATTTNLFSFNPLTGKEVASQALNFRIKHLIPLPGRDAEYRKVMMVVGHKKGEIYEVSTFPEAASSQLEKSIGSLFWYDIDKEANSVAGYRVVESNDKGKFVSEQTWQVGFSENEKIDSVAGRNLEDTVFAPYYVTGSHDVLYKYLNPNMIALSTVSDSPPFFKGSKGQGRGSSVHMYCLDTVTGHILYHVAHPQSKGPTHMAISENWVAHTYWSERNLRTELSVLELWEDFELKEDFLALLMRGLGFGEQKKMNTFVKKKQFATGDEQGDTFSSYSKRSPQKEEQSYIFPAVVKALGVTSTEMGITSKTLLVGTSANQLYSLPKKFFDARRPLKAPTPEEAEEGLMQYSPILPFIPTSVLSYNHTVADIRAMKAVPVGGLESTSLVLAYGVDIFFCRVAPSKTFDMLPEDFQYGILALTIVGLTVAVFAVSMMSKRKDLNNLWK